ncbi:MAG: Rieske (2Fe-2S) protein [Verrucomicrobiales bacterium]
MSNYVKVANVADVSADKPFSASIQGKAITVVLHEGNYFAFNRDCPHKMTPLDAGMVQDGKIICPMHGWGFDLKTGACDTNPNKPLPCYPVRVENGEIQALVS